MSLVATQDMSEQQLNEILDGTAEAKAETPTPTEPAKTDEAATPDTATANADAGAEPATTEAGEQPTHVLAKDGKHVLPFKVVEQERERALNLERDLEQTRKDLEALREQVKNGGPIDLDSIKFVSEEELAEMEADGASGIAAQFRSYQETITKLSNAVKSSQQKENEQQSQEQDKALADLRQAALDAFDEHPKALELRATNADGMANLIAIDNALAQTWPAQTKEDFSKRYASAIATYEARFGEIKVQTATEPPGKPEEPAKPAAPKAEPNKSPAPSTTPVSMSAMPGSGNPPVDEVSNLGRMSAAGRLDAMNNMSVEQLQALMDKVG